jgi:phage terminase large subunit GpA-like protein
MCASQLMKTEILINFLGYVIDLDPGPMLIVEPREADAETLSKDRIAPMLRDTPCLQGKVSSSRSRDAGNTTLHKTFIGGHVTFVGAISPSGLAMRPIRYALMDEIDRYPASAGSEGSPTALVIRRTDEFFWNKKIVMCSTPTIEGRSAIAAAYEESDQGRPLVPCPHCGEFQELSFYNLKWEKGEESNPQYRCEHCSALIAQHQKAWMLDQGKWIKQNPGSKIRGFWISQMYSTRRTWGDLVEEFVSAEKQPEKLKTFVNTVLAETWKERGEAPDWQRLYARREHYAAGTAPRGVLFLTAGVDVQADRLEICVLGWGRRKNSWLVDYIVLNGDTAREEVWEQLTQIMGTMYRHEAGNYLQIRRMCIDSGYATQSVYGWARKHSKAIVSVVKGASGTSGPPVAEASAVDINTSGKKLKRGIGVHSVNVFILKAELYRWLKQDPPTDEGLALGEKHPEGFFHYYQKEEEYFKQLTAEQLMTRVLKGYPKTEWHKTRDRNEALDTWIYARAAAHMLRLDRLPEEDWVLLEQALGIKDVPAPIVQAALLAENPEPIAEQTISRGNGYIPRRSGWLNR